MSNNEFIKVDDLFRGKPDREERIPPGAWSNMQHLLDTAGTAGGSIAGAGLNRYVALALLTLGIGATAVTWQYKMQAPSMFSQTNTEAGNQELSPNGHNPSTVAQSAPASMNGMKSGLATANPDQETVAQQANAPTNTVTASNSTQTHAPVNQNVSGNASSITSISQHTPKEHRQTGNRKADRKARQIANKHTQETNAIVQNLAAIPATGNTAPSGQSAADQALAAIDKNVYAPKATADSQYMAVVAGPTQKYVLKTGAEGQWYKEKSKIVNEIHTTRRLIRDNKNEKVTGIRMDTTKNVRFTRTYLEPLNEQDKMQLLAITSRSTGIFMKAKPISVLSPRFSNNNASVAESNVSVAPLATYKVGSTNAQKGTFAKHFYDVLSNYLNMEKPYYFSAAIGMNSTLSNYMPTGYHFSIGGYYELKERVTLGVELKYAHAGLLPQNIFETFRVYENQTETVIGGQTMYSATAYTKQNSYQLKGISSFELPVTLRYQLSKFSIFGGLQANYVLPVKYTSILNQDKESAKTVFSETAMVSGNGKINENDFRARMGLGYTLGLVYDLSKHVSFDMRMSHTLWNNVQQTSQLSDQLYKYPNVQFSLFYYLGKKDKVIYMMSDRK